MGATSGLCAVVQRDRLLCCPVRGRSCPRFRTQPPFSAAFHLRGVASDGDSLDCVRVRLSTCYFPQTFEQILLSVWALTLFFTLFFHCTSSLSLRLPLLKPALEFNQVLCICFWLCFLGLWAALACLLMPLNLAESPKKATISAMEARALT